MVADTINSIKTHLGEAYSALEEKEATIPEKKNVENLADSILSISGGGEEIAHPEYVSFYAYSGKSLDLSWLRTDRMTTMVNMFRNSSMTNLDLSKFNMNNVTNTEYMFDSSSVTTVDLSHTNMNKVTSAHHMFSSSSANNIKLGDMTQGNLTNMQSMFSGGTYKTIDLSNINTENVTNMQYAFAGNINLNTTDLTKLNTKNVTTMEYMFSGQNWLSSALDYTLNLSSFDFSNVTTMANFHGQTSSSVPLGITRVIFPEIVNAPKLTNLQAAFKFVNLKEFPKNLENFDTSNVTSFWQTFIMLCQNTPFDYQVKVKLNWNTNKATTFYGMFSSYSNYTYESNASRVVEHDLRTFTGDNCTNTQYMFNNCRYTKKINLANLNTPKLTNASYMFNYCLACEEIDIRNMDFSKVTPATNYTNIFGASATSGVPDNCKIIVKDDTQRNWITSKFSRLTNVVTVDELED